VDTLPFELSEKPFTLRQAIKLGLNRYFLRKLIAEGVVEQLARGIYRRTKDDISEEDQYRSATLRVGSPSAVCLVSALAHHGLTDSIPKKTWMMVTNTKRTNFADIKVFRARSPKWKIGIEKCDGYSITKIERTIVDCLVQREKLGIQIGITALRNAISSRKSNLGKILDTAIKLGVAHRVRPYIEALS